MTCNCNSYPNCICGCNCSCTNNCSCDCNSDNVPDCGCTQKINADCVIYRGDTSTCVPITKGQDLATIVKNIGDFVCQFTPSGQLISVVEGTNNEIVVSSSTVGKTTTYTVSLDSDITTAIGDLQSDVASLQTCCDNSVKTIITDTPEYLTITDDSNGNYTINYAAPSGQIIYDGIIESDLDQHATTGGGGTQTLKTFNYNYYVNSLLQSKEEIRFTIEGQIASNNGLVDTILFEVFNPSTSTVVYSFPYRSFNNDTTNSFSLKGTITGKTIATVNGSALLSLELSRITQALGDVGDVSRLTAVWSKGLTGIDYSNLTLRIKFVNNSLLTTSFIQKFEVEVRKKI